MINQHEKKRRQRHERSETRNPLVRFTALLFQLGKSRQEMRESADMERGKMLLKGSPVTWKKIKQKGSQARDQRPWTMIKK